MTSLLKCAYILYILPLGQSKGCDLAIHLVNSVPNLKQDVYIQNVHLIEKPSWMTGVPVLAKIVTKDVWMGTKVIEQLKYLVEVYSKEILNVPSRTGPWQSKFADLSLPQPLQQSQAQALQPPPQQQQQPLQTLSSDLSSAEPSVTQPLVPQQQSFSQPFLTPSQAPFPPSNYVPVQPQSQPQLQLPLQPPSQNLGNGPLTFPPLDNTLNSNQPKSDPNKILPIPQKDDNPNEPKPIQLPPLKKFGEKPVTQVPTLTPTPTQQPTLTQPLTQTRSPNQSQNEQPTNSPFQGFHAESSLPISPFDNRTNISQRDEVSLDNQQQLFKSNQKTLRTNNKNRTLEHLSVNEQHLDEEQLHAVQQFMLKPKTTNTKNDGITIEDITENAGGNNGSSSNDNSQNNTSLPPSSKAPRKPLMRQKQTKHINQQNQLNQLNKLPLPEPTSNQNSINMEKSTGAQ